MTVNTPSLVGLTTTWPNDYVAERLRGRIAMWPIRNPTTLPYGRPRHDNRTRRDSGYPVDGVDLTLSTVIFNRVLNAARYSSPIPMLTA